MVEDPPTIVFSVSCVHEKINHAFVATGGEVLLSKYNLTTEYQCALRVIRVIRNRWAAYACGRMWQRDPQAMFSYRFRSVSS